MPAIVPVGFLGGSTGGGEVLLILLVALLLFGSKNLPHIARTIGKTLEEVRRAARDVRDEIMRADLEEPSKRPVLPPPPSDEKKDAPDDTVAR